MIDRTRLKGDRGATDRAPRESIRAGADNAPRIVSVDEAIAEYPGEWLLMRVTGYGSRRVPARGEIVARRDSMSEIFQTLARVLRAAPEPCLSYYTFQANPQARTGAEIRASQAELLAQDDGDARILW